MSYSPFPWQNAASYNLGSTLFTSGNVSRPDDGEGMSVAPTQILLQQAFGALWFMAQGGASNVYIIGNGVPPAGGYTPTTRPIKILGPQGLEAFVSTNITFGASGAITLSPARTADRLQRDAKLNSTTGALSYQELSLAPSDSGHQPADVDVGQTITAITATIDASTGAGLPATRATIALYKGTSTGWILHESLQDPTATLGAYRTVHAFTLTLAVPLTVAANMAYLVVLVGESGSGDEVILWVSSSVAASRASVNLNG